MRYGNLNNAMSRRHAWMVLIACWVAQPPARAQLDTETIADFRQNPRPAVVERNAPAENLLKKAQAAVERDDWKLAIDSLQRILDDAAPGLLQIEPAESNDEAFIRYERPSFRAREMLLSFPPEGIEAYRLLHDGRAETLDHKARDRQDPHLTAEVVYRYPISSAADEAAERLAQVRMDHGDAAGAIELLDFITEQYPDTDVSRERIAAMKAVCFLMSGDNDRARSLVETELQADSPVETAIRELVASGWRAVEETGGAEDWPMVGGGSLRRSMMPAIAPELRANVPWRFALPSDYPDWWENYWQEQDDHERREPPACRAVVAGGRVFLRCLRGLVALDLESLEPLWIKEESPQPAAHRFARQSGLFMPTAAVVHAPYSDRDRMLYDQAGALVSVSGDLVFTVQREGGDETPAFHRVNRITIAPIETSGTMLVARNVADGELRWTQGRSTAEDDPLGSVAFLSAPLVIERELWCVYARGTDVFLGVLDPADGSLRRELPLCSVDAAQLADMLHEAIYPAFDGSRLYLTAGVGLVLAVDVESFALAWATGYPRLPAIPGAIAPLSWLPGPPICAGTSLVAAPPDSDFLMALDRTDGSIRWTLARPADSNYVLAAGDRDVWLGGERFFRIRLSDGSEAWASSQRDRIEPGGRAALSGSRIFAPTRDGLLAFDAGTGERIELMPLPEDQLPLGNLLCIGGALISTDTNEVRKFPDLTLSYPRALARHEADPNDRRAAVRLAWLELLRSEPAKAFAALEGVRIPRSEASGQTAAVVAKLRVDALIGMARDEQCDAGVAIEHLEQALQLATADRDRLRAVLALAGKLRDTGRVEEAYLRLWEIGLSSAGDGFVTIEPRLRNKARRVVAYVLSRFERELTARQLAAIAERSHEALVAASKEAADVRTRGRGLDRLRQLAELNDAGGGGQHALILLARAARDEDQYERSAQDYEAAIRMNRLTPLTALATAELADMYLSLAPPLVAEAGALIDRLSGKYASVALPEEDPQRLGADAATAIEKLRGRMNSTDIPAPSLAPPDRFQFADAPPHTIAGEGVSLMSRASLAGQSIGPGVLLQTGSDRIASVPPEGGDAEWSAALTLLGHELDVLDTTRSAATGVAYPRVFVDGQTAIVNGSQGTFAVGTLTGRRLWGTPYDSPETASALNLRDRLVAVRDGRVVFAPRRGVLAAATVRDGDDLLWERVLTGDKIDSILLEDGYCITIDNQRQVVTTYDATDGRLRSRVAFTQPKPDDDPIPASYIRGQIVVPDGSQTVACYSVGTGTDNWQTDLGEPVRWIFKPGNELVGVACDSGRVVLIDVLGGDIVFDQQVAAAKGGLVEGVVCDDSLLMLAVTVLPQGEEPVLVSYDMATQQQRWRRDEFGITGANRFAMWRLLGMARDVLPMFRKVEVESENNFTRAMGDVLVETVDKRTGRTIGPVVSTGHSTSQRERLTGAFEFVQGYFIVGTYSGVLSLKTTVNSTDGAEAQRLSDGRQP